MNAPGVNDAGSRGSEKEIEIAGDRSGDMLFEGGETAVIATPAKADSAIRKGSSRSVWWILMVIAGDGDL